MKLDDLKSANRTVGAKQTSKAIKRNLIKFVFIASDSEGRISAPIIDLCIQHQVPYDNKFNMDELGKAVNIKVSAAAVGVLK